MSWFKKPQIHEPVEKQNEEVLSHVAGPLAASGEDCDEMAGATGPFGTQLQQPHTGQCPARKLQVSDKAQNPVWRTIAVS